jgi:hypothetical protein
VLQKTRHLAIVEAVKSYFQTDRAADPNDFSEPGELLQEITRKTGFTDLSQSELQRVLVPVALASTWLSLKPFSASSFAFNLKPRPEQVAEITGAVTTTTTLRRWLAQASARRLPPFTLDQYVMDTNSTMDQARAQVVAPVFVYGFPDVTNLVGSTDEPVVASFAQLFLSTVHDDLIQKNSLPEEDELCTYRESTDDLWQSPFMPPLPKEVCKLVADRIPDTLDHRLHITKFYSNLGYQFTLAEWPESDPEGKAKWKILMEREVHEATQHDVEEEEDDIYDTDTQGTETQLARPRFLNYPPSRSTKRKGKFEHARDSQAISSRARIDEEEEEEEEEDSSVGNVFGKTLDEMVADMEQGSQLSP